MSWQASEWAMAQSAGSSRAKLVLLVLAEAASAQGVTLIGIETIARRAELGERTVWSALQELATGDAPLITRRRRLDAKGHRTSDEVTLHMAPAQLATVAIREPAQLADAATGDAGLLAIYDTPYSQPTTIPTRKDCDGTGQRNRSEEPVRLSESGSQPLSPSRRKPETSIPDDFPAGHLVEAAQAKFGQLGLAIDARLEAEGFRSYHLSKDSRFREWPQAWATWTGKTVTYAQQRGARRQGRGSGVAWALEGME